jgi:hypothetical protein
LLRGPAFGYFCNHAGLTIERHFATALTRLLNALQVGDVGSLPTEAMLATMLLASQARSASEVNG